jgi:hypothetical protein
MKVFNVAAYEICDGFIPGSSYDAYAFGCKQCVHWIRDRPLASIVVAVIDEQPNGELDIGLRLSAISGYRLIGLIQALIGHTLTVVEQSPVATGSQEYDVLREIKALLDGGRPPAN